jgi:hypothetical protein
MTFKKSTFSNPNGSCVEVEIGFKKSSHCSGGDCVEVGMGFKKSRTSYGHGDCVEVGAESDGSGEVVVRVRDSKQTDLDGNPNGPVLEFNEKEWEAFLKGMDAGRNCEFRIARLSGCTCGDSGDTATGPVPVVAVACP